MHGVTGSPTAHGALVRRHFGEIRGDGDVDSKSEIEKGIWLTLLPSIQIDPSVSYPVIHSCKFRGSTGFPSWWPSKESFKSENGRHPVAKSEESTAWLKAWSGLTDFDSLQTCTDICRTHIYLILFAHTRQ